MIDNPARQTILVVDDTPENIDVITELLSNEYRVKAAMNGEKALKIVDNDSKIDLILLDIMMPGMDGYAVCKRLKENPLTKGIPVIFLTAKGEVEAEAKGFKLGAVDYITKPISPSIVQARVKTHLALHDQNKALESKVHQRTKELHDTRLEIIRRLGRAAEFKDNETGLHVIRMSYYSKVIGKAIGMNEHESEMLLQTAPMHDIGKIGIPDSILLKPGKLDDDEWKVIRKHPAFGYEIIGEHSSELLENARVVALTHHEKWDGTGYPNGTAGEDIPLVGRITAVADVFDALTSNRPYKEAWPVEKALSVINEESGKHFEPMMVDAFMMNIPEVEKIKSKYGEPEA